MLFSLRAQYTRDSMQALIQNPTDRSQTVRAALECVGGRLISFYTTGGGQNQGILAIYETSDANTNAALVCSAIASDEWFGIDTQRLYSMEETVDALRKAQTIRNTWQAPQQQMRSTD